VFGLEHVSVFGFDAPLAEAPLARDRYDLIVLHEVLTHSPDPHAVLDWVDERLAAGGRAVFYREPDTPAYRPYQPLEIVFNNFHLNLFSAASLARLIAGDGRFSARLYDDTHPSYTTPVYVNVVAERGNGDVSPAPPVHPPAFYDSWLARDRSAVRRFGHRLRQAATRRLRALR
jgi:hypothetical protein